MFRRKVVSIALTISLSLMISGCATDPFQGAYAARADQVDTPKTLFKYGEGPCIVIIGYNGQTIAGEIRRLNDDRLVHRWTDYVPKGWVDRVLRPGVAYEFIGEDQGDGVPNGLLKAGSAIVFNTSNTITEREKNVFGDPLETIWKNCIFSLCGVNNFYRHTFNIMVVSTKTQRKQWLQEVQRTIDRIYP